MDPNIPNPATISVRPAAAGSPDAVDAIARLETQLGRLRAACAEQAEQAAQREAHLRTLAQSLQSRERELAATQAELAMRQAQLEDHQAALARGEEGLRTAREAVRQREADLARIQQRLEGLKESLRSVSGNPSRAAGDELEGLITSAVRSASDAEERAARAESRIGELSEQLARVVGEHDASATAARDELTQLAHERDQLRARLERHEREMRKAGLEIEWGAASPSRKRRSG